MRWRDAERTGTSVTADVSVDMIPPGPVASNTLRS